MTISIIFFGAQAVFANELSIGQLIAFNMMAGNVVNPLISLVMTASGWETFKIAKKRLEELEPAQIKNPTFKKEALDLNGTIEFQDVWFRYPSNNVSESDIEANLVLKGINLSIQPGEIIGIVGGSGSGKSTLANLLLGFYKPTRGKIKINGYDIDLIPPEVLRSRISSVQQTNFLFNTSVLENVHLGRLNSSIEELNNQLETLDARNGNNDLFVNFNVLNNPNLDCILVDDPTAPYLLSWSVDQDTLFGSTTQNCQPLVLDDNEVLSQYYYPNPVQKTLFIESTNPLVELYVYSSSGAILIKQTSSQPKLLYQIDLSSLTTGVYYLKTVTTSSRGIKKIVKY